MILNSGALWNTALPARFSTVALATLKARCALWPAGGDGKIWGKALILDSYGYLGGNLLNRTPWVWSKTWLLYVLCRCMDFCKLHKWPLLWDSAKVTLWSDSVSQSFYSLTQVIGNKRPGQVCAQGDCRMGDILTGLVNYSLFPWRM